MKTFVTMAVVATLALAITFINFSQTSAQRCSERPPVNTTEVTCDQRGRRPGQVLQILACVLRCRACYERKELQRLPGCLVDKKCLCLGQENSNATTNATSTTTSDGRLPSDITDSSDIAESSDSETDRELTSPEAPVSNDEETTTTEDSDVINGGDDTETEITSTSE